MSRSTSTLQSVLGAAFWSEMDNVYTSIPCIVISVRDNGAGAMVDIQPTINQKFVDGRESRRTPILGVPVSFPMSSNAGIMFPIKVGTTGLAIFSMRSLETWKDSDGGFVSPNNRAKFDKSEAIFLPGIQPPSVNLTNPSKHVFPHSTDDTVVINNIGTGTENEIRLAANGDITLNTAQNVNVNCANMNVNAAADITMQCGNFQLSASSATFDIGSTSWSGTINGSGGMFTYNGVEYNTHAHTGVTTGNGTSGPPV